jgi:hypothetical protein
VNKADLDVCNHIEHRIYVFKYNLKRAAYHGGKFNGVHCRKIMQEGDGLIDDIESYLKEFKHASKLADDNEIEVICDLIKRLLRTLNTVFSKLRMPHGTPVENDYEVLETAIGQAAKLWEELDLNYTPKFHLLHVHALPFMRQHKGFGEMLEDDLEKSHQDMDRIHRRLAGLGSCSKRADAISRRESTRSTPAVQATLEGVNTRNTRTRSQPSAAQQRGVENKKKRDAKRVEDAEEEERKPAAVVLRKSSEVTKQEFAKHNT